jgi:hypothetical protein
MRAVHRPHARRRPFGAVVGERQRRGVGKRVGAPPGRTSTARGRGAGRGLTAARERGVSVESRIPRPTRRTSPSADRRPPRGPALNAGVQVHRRRPGRIAPVACRRGVSVDDRIAVASRHTSGSTAARRDEHQRGGVGQRAGASRAALGVTRRRHAPSIDPTRPPALLRRGRDERQRLGVGERVRASPPARGPALNARLTFSHATTPHRSPRDASRQLCYKPTQRLMSASPAHQRSTHDAATRGGYGYEFSYRAWRFS